MVRIAELINMKHKWTGKETWIPKIIKIMESTSGIKHKEIDLIALMADELGKQREKSAEEIVRFVENPYDYSTNINRYHDWESALKAVSDYLLSPKSNS